MHKFGRKETTVLPYTSSGSFRKCEEVHRSQQLINAQLIHCARGAGWSRQGDQLETFQASRNVGGQQRDGVQPIIIKDIVHRYALH